ncbi:MAG: hypothetical protein KGN34_06945 [Sphingomonadales bacterium]|nr:hypothetical protein [Sphingomonadales bacterium]
MSAAGTWNVTVKTPMGDQTGAFTVTVDGNAFEGRLTNPMMGELATESGQINGNTLTWKMAMTTPMPMALDGEAVIEGDTLTGKIVAGMFGAMALTGTRA